MGWRGTLRSIAAAQRQAERAAIRRQRELERQHKQHTKMLEREAAAYEVEVYQNQLEVLQSIHRDCGQPIDWLAILNAPEPTVASPTAKEEGAAKRTLAGYSPSFLDKLFRRVDARRARLVQAVSEGKAADEVANASARRRYEEALADWIDRRALAERILAGGASAYHEVIQELNPFQEME